MSDIEDFAHDEDYTPPLVPDGTLECFPTGTVAALRAQLAAVERERDERLAQVLYTRQERDTNATLLTTAENAVRGQLEATERVRETAGRWQPAYQDEFRVSMALREQLAAAEAELAALRAPAERGRE